MRPSLTIARCTCLRFAHELAVLIKVKCPSFTPILVVDVVSFSLLVNLMTIVATLIVGYLIILFIIDLFYVHHVVSNSSIFI